MTLEGELRDLVRAMVREELAAGRSSAPAVEYLDCAGAATRTAMSPGWWRRECRLKRVDGAVRVGRGWRIPVAAIDAHMRRGTPAVERDDVDALADELLARRRARGAR